MTRSAPHDLTWLPPADDAEVAAGLVAAAREAFGRPPDGVWAAPGRVNLIGEHTDYNAGLSLPFALPHRTYAAVARRPDGVLRIASRQKDGTGWEGRVAEVYPASPGRGAHPAGWTAYVAGVFATLADHLGADQLGADVLVDGRVPLGAGLSSSAALSCSVAVAVRDLVPELRDLDDADLVAACVRAENDFAGAATGGMDQTVSVRAREGHLLLIDSRDGAPAPAPVPWSLPDHRVLVIDTRVHHSLADGQYAARRQTCEAAAAALGLGALRELDPARLDDPEVIRALMTVPDGLARVRHVVTENARVEDVVRALAEPAIHEVGVSMTASHVSLRDDYEVSCRELDVAVDAALAAGAVGARMTGGGFGGSAVALVPADQVEQVATAVTWAFTDEGWRTPRFAVAEPSRPAGRVNGGEG